MKRWILTIAAVTVCAAASAAEITAQSAVTKVTVYQDRALVTREAEVDLIAGSNTVTFENLPVYLLEESLRADGRGASAVALSGVELKKTFSPEEINPRIAAVTEELLVLEDEMRALQNKAEALRDQKRFLDSVSNFSSVQIPKEIVTKSSAPAEWTGLSKFMLDAFNENSASSLENEKAVRLKQREVEAKQLELSELSQGRSAERKSAAVLLEAKENTRFKIELTYLVPQAAWNVSYDVKAYPDKKSGTLVSYGSVRQWTGEDWKEAKLTLSTAKPVIGGRMPELQPWRVDFPQARPAPEAYQRKNMMLSAKQASFSDEADSSVGAAPQLMEAARMEMPQAAVSQELGSVTFEIGKPSTVLSDNQPRRLPVKSENFPLALDYETTPKITPYVFIHSKVTNDKDYTLAAGEISIFVDDNFVGKSSIATVGQGEEFDLYLGIDESVKVKRTELVDKRKKAMLGLRTRKDYAYQFEVENFKKEAIAVTVIDQVPVSGNSEIKAEFVSSSLEPAENKKRAKELGILEWKLSLKPAEKKKFEYQFFVEYPAGREVAGI